MTCSAVHFPCLRKTLRAGAVIKNGKTGHAAAACTADRFHQCVFFDSGDIKNAAAGVTYQMIMDVNIRVKMKDPITYIYTDQLSCVLEHQKIAVNGTEADAGE